MKTVWRLVGLVCVVVAVGIVGGATIAVSGAGSAQAQVTDQPPVALAYTNLTAVRVNPLGLVNYFDTVLRLRLFEHDSDVLKQNFIGIGGALGLSPAWVRAGVMAEVQPLTILRLWARYTFAGYFGTTDLMASFPSAEADFSDSAIDARAELPGTEAYATHGGELTLGAQAQILVGPIAVRNHLRLYYGHFDLRDGDTTYYDSAYDLLMPNHGWGMTNDTEALFITDFGLIAGAAYTFAHAFYRDEHRAAGATAVSNDIHRLGPVIAYRFAREPGGRFDAPVVLVLCQWHLAHRFRTGQDVSQAIPYLALAFNFRGDFLADF